MKNIMQSIREDKKEYREQMARVAKLPKDYRFVYEKIQSYMWGFAGGTGMDMLKTQYELIDLFEAGAAQNKHVLHITGEDVAAFCDGLMRDNRLWIDHQRKKLNQEMSKIFDKEENT